MTDRWDLSYLYQGFDDLINETARQLETLPPVLHYQEEEEISDAEAEKNAYTITKENGVFIVSGPGIEHLIDSVNFEDQESLNWFHRTLRRIGVIDSLRAEGAEEGSTVQIAGMEFEFIE